MSVLEPKDYELLLGCLGEIYSLSDSAEFPMRLLAAVAALVRADLITLTEVDPVLNKSTGYSYPEAPVQDFEEAFQRNIKDHPVVRHIQTTRDGRAKAISDFLSAKAFRATGLYREVFEPLGVEDQLSIAMVASGGLLIGISFNRARRGFSQRDREILNLLRPHVLQAYMNCRARHLINSQVNEGHASVMEQLPLGLICVKANGRIDWSTSSAQQMLRDFYPENAGSLHGLPDAVRYWLKRVTSKTAADTPAHLLSHRPGLELRMRYSRLDDGRAVLLLQEYLSTKVAPSLANFGFTAREEQVAASLVNGDSIPQIAQSLAMSPRTVGKHLERIFKKLGVNNLAAACVKMLKSDNNPA
jgi:DNA-binding CsgD family transcriptional regulator